MTWLLKKSNDKTFEFVNQESNADITRFVIEKDQQLRWKLVIECNNQGKEKIISRFGTDTLVKKFLNSVSSFEKKYTITNEFLAENTILAINSFYYILQQHRGLISKNFGFPNLFYNERQAGRLAITLAMQKGFDVGYQYAKKELERTNSESSCMEMLAEHSEAFAKEIANRHVKKELEKTILDESLYMKMLPENNGAYVKEIASHQSELKIKKEQTSPLKSHSTLFKHIDATKLNNMNVDVSDKEMAASAFGQGSYTAQKLANKKFR